MMLLLAALVFTDVRLAWDPPDEQPEPIAYYELLIAPEGTLYPFGWQRLTRTKSNETTVVFYSYPLSNRMEVVVRAFYGVRGSSRPSNKILLDPALYEPEQFRFNYPPPSPQPPPAGRSSLRAGRAPIRRRTLRAEGEFTYRRSLAARLRASLESQNKFSPAAGQTASETYLAP